MSDVDITPNLSESQIPAAPVPANGAEPPASATGPAETAAPGQEAPPAEKPKRDRSVEKRISRLTQQRESAIREAGYWRGIAEARASAPASEQPTTEGQPSASSHPPAREIPAATRADIEHNKTVLERLAESGEDIEDFDDVMDTITSDDFPVSRTMRDYLGEADNPALVAKWLADNPKEARRIAHLDPAVAVRALERAEAKLAKPAPKATRASAAPPPTPSVSGSGPASQSIERMSHEEIKKLVAGWSRK